MDPIVPFYENHFQTKLNEAEQEMVQEHYKREFIPKKTLLFRAGDANTKHYLIEKGMLRLFLVDSKGKEINMKGLFIKLWTLCIGIMILLQVNIVRAQIRHQSSLNDHWKFSLVAENQDAKEIEWSDISIPHTWNAHDIQSGDQVHYGKAYYQRELILDTSQKDLQHFIRFEGVGQYAQLYVNDKYVGEHLGSYSAFAFDISSFLRPDTINSLLLKVSNELADSYPKDNFLFGIFGGIYRNVTMISTHHLHLDLCDEASSGVYIHQEEVDKTHAKLRIVSLLKNETSEKKSLLIKNQLLDNKSEIIAETMESMLLQPGGVAPFTSILQIEHPHLWNGKKDPYLYRVQTQVIYEDQIVDQVSNTIGLRSFSIDTDKGFILNGEPYRLYGVCRHQEWQDLGNALLPEHHKRDMDLIDEIGATSIRLAHYQQAEYIYALADSLGILVWAEIPFVNGYQPGGDANAKQQLSELIKQNFNHASIFVWGLHNEVIKNGIITEAVNLSNELHHLAKDLDPSRYTVSVSNIWWIHDHPIHELADLQGFNQYTGWYGGQPEELGNWITNYHSKKPDIRVSISEYGAGGNISHQTGDMLIPEPPKPTGSFFPETYQTYYHEETYAAIENSSFIWSSYVWNMFDFSVPEWNRGGIKGRNHKGLITYDRKIKKDAFYWYKANWSEEAVLYLVGRRNHEIHSLQCHFKAYSNVGAPELFINDKSYGEMLPGINSTQYISKQIDLEPGKYKIQVKASNEKGDFLDEYDLIIKNQ